MIMKMQLLVIFFNRYFGRGLDVIQGCMAQSLGLRSVISVMRGVIRRRRVNSSSSSCTLLISVTLQLIRVVSCCWKVIVFFEGACRCITWIWFGFLCSIFQQRRQFRVCIIWYLSQISYYCFFFWQSRRKWFGFSRWQKFVVSLVFSARSYICVFICFTLSWLVTCSSVVSGVLLLRWFVGSTNSMGMSFMEDRLVAALRGFIFRRLRRLFFFRITGCLQFFSFMFYAIWERRNIGFGYREGICFLYFLEGGGRTRRRTCIRGYRGFGVRVFEFWFRYLLFG